MSDDKLRQVRVLHLVSSGGAVGSMQQSLFMPLLTRMPKLKVKAQVISLAPGFTSGAVLRQAGIPVYDVPLSKRRFEFGSLGELLAIARQFRPDVLQAWGHTAQLAAMYVRKRCDWKPKVVWSIAETAPIARDAGLIDRRKLKMTASRAGKADRIVYASEAGASQHRRVGYPDSGHAVIPLGIDPTRFKPDYAARRKVRDQLGLAADAFVIGMVAPFQPEYDHATLLKGVGELIKTHPNVSVILAGHGVQKGNASLMTLVGGGTLSTRVHLLGEWSDTAAFFAACDVACSSALNDSARMTLVMAMLCGVPCVATGIGAQGEVLGRFGVAIEGSSPPAIARGVTRIMQMPEDRRIAMVQGARKHALSNFVSVLSLQKYLQLYYDVVGRQALADVPAPNIDASIPVPPADLNSSTRKSERSRAAAAALVSLHQISDPDSLEEQVPEIPGAYQPPPTPPPLARKEDKPASDGDVLKIFESDVTRVRQTDGNPMSERARGVAEDLGDLLAPEELHTVAVTAQPPAPKPVESKAAKPATPTPASTNAPAPTTSPTEQEKPAAPQPKSALPASNSPPSLIEFSRLISPTVTPEAVQPAQPKAATPSAARALPQLMPAPHVTRATAIEPPRFVTRPSMPPLIATDPPRVVLPSPPVTELKVVPRTPVARTTPVQLPMLPMLAEADEFGFLPDDARGATTVQLRLLPDDEDEQPFAAAG